MDFEHTDECEQRERTNECLQCWQSQPAGDCANPLGDIAERTPDGTSHNGPCAERRAYSLKTYGDAEYQCTNEAGRGCRCQCHRVTIREAGT
jgi:hypothetical protein